MSAITTFADDACRQLLEANGLDNLDALFAQAQRLQLRHAGRGVVCRTLTAGVVEPTTVFIKLNWGRRRLWPRLTDLRNGQHQKTLPEREWDGLTQCARLGLHVPERIALFRDGLLNLRAAVVVCKVPPEKSLDDMLADGSWLQLPPDERSAILAAVVETTATIHRAGFGWRGTGKRHFFPERLPDGTYRTWIIDCEGIHRGANPRIVARDYDKLLRSMQESGTDARTLDALQSLIDATIALQAARVGRCPNSRSRRAA